MKANAETLFAQDNNFVIQTARGAMSLSNGRITIKCRDESMKGWRKEDGGWSRSVRTISSMITGLKKAAALLRFWEMAGTEQIGEYIVIGLTPRGFVGVRSGPCSSLREGQYRVRVEPSLSVLTDAQFEGAFPSFSWNQPGRQPRYSIVVGQTQLSAALGRAKSGLWMKGIPFIMNPKIPKFLAEEWDKTSVD